MSNIIDDTEQINIDILELEDFTTYEVVDPWGGVINVTQNQIDVVNEPATGSGYVRKVFPEGTFTDFTHTFKATLNNLDPAHNIGIWAVTNGASNYYEMYRDLDGLALVFFRTASGTNRISIMDMTTYPDTISDFYNNLLSVTYTFVIKRAGNILTCEIYDGTVLLDTLSITCNTIPCKQLVPHFSYRVGAVDLYGSATITDYDIG